METLSVVAQRSTTSDVVWQCRQTPIVIEIDRHDVTLGAIEPAVAATNSAETLVQTSVADQRSEELQKGVLPNVKQRVELCTLNML